MGFWFEFGFAGAGLASAMVWRRERQAEAGGDLFGSGLLKNLAEQFVRLHGVTMRKRRRVGKFEARGVFRIACCVLRKSGSIRLSPLRLLYSSFPRIPAARLILLLLTSDVICPR